MEKSSVIMKKEGVVGYPRLKNNVPYRIHRDAPLYFLYNVKNNLMEKEFPMENLVEKEFPMEMT